MKTIRVLENQTIYDIATMYYGSCEAVAELLENNQNLTNDDTALTAENIDSVTNKDFYADIALQVGQKIVIDQQSYNIDRNIVKEIDNEITTYGT